MPRSSAQPAVGVHRLVRQSCSVCATSGWSGISRSPARFSAQATWSGNTAASRSSRLHALQLRRDLAAAAEARQRERGGRVPAPAHAEQRRVEQRLHQHVERGRRVQVARDLVERKAVAGRQRQHDRVLGRRGLQLEVEVAAEALAQRQAPGAVDAAAERRMDHQLHAARLVEEALDDDRARCVGSAPSAASARREVVDELARRVVVEADRRDQPATRRLGAVRVELRARPRSRRRETAERQLVAAPRRLAEPERDARRRAVRVLDAHAARLDAQDAVAGVAELEHVAGDALDREVLVDRADACAPAARARRRSRRSRGSCRPR